MSRKNRICAYNWYKYELSFGRVQEIAELKVTKICLRKYHLVRAFSIFSQQIHIFI